MRGWARCSVLYVIELAAPVLGMASSWSCSNMYVEGGTGV